MLNDFKNILKKPILLLSMLAIATIPAIYTTIFLGSMWDPYASKDQLIIDVVNEDEGAEMDGEEINLGEDLKEELGDNDEFKWHFSDMEEATEDLGRGEIYGVVKIPADASEKAARLLRMMRQTSRWKSRRTRATISSAPSWERVPVMRSKRK